MGCVTAICQRPGLSRRRQRAAAISPATAETALVWRSRRIGPRANRLDQAPGTGPSSAGWTSHCTALLLSGCSPACVQDRALRDPTRAV